jgi:hypothetical protein
MVKTFAELKAKSESGEFFDQISHAIRYDLGMHKKTRLKLAGVISSGSLLHNSVSEIHANKLAEELKERARKIGVSANERFRFMTALQSVVSPTVEDVTAAVEQMERDFAATVGEMKLWSRGAIELEMVNLGILKKISSVSDGASHKFNVLSTISELREFQGMMIGGSASESSVLVHCHVVVDMGKNAEFNEAELRKRIKRRGCWNERWQLEIKSLFKKRSVAKNLNAIAAYVTKGGNENLRYNAGFKRDLGEDLEAKIWRAGLDRKDKGGETVEDERGLTLWEVRQLDQLYVWLMKRRRDKRGYIISSSER